MRRAEARDARRSIAILCLIALELPVLAAPRRVLVLPLDGSADAATRQKLTTSVQRLARVIDGTVQPGDTTFAETAAAVGCDPAVPSCADDVRTMLGVDELVWGTADASQGKVTIVLRRKAKDADPREVTTTMGTTDSPEKVEPALLPLFSASGTAATTVTEPVGEPTTQPPLTDPDAPATDPATEPPIDRPREPTSTDKKYAIAAITGGGLLFVFGLASWASASSVNKQIEDHDTEDVEDFQQLEELESRASTRAWAGNLLVVAGLALGGFGGYLLWRDRQSKLTVAPTPVDGGGAALTFTFGPVR